jgi:hypothetical protein
MNKTVLALFGIALVSLWGVAGCESATPPVNSITEMGRDSTNVEQLRITADDLLSVPEGSTLVVRVTESDEVIVFDPSRGPIDFSRLDIAFPNGHQMRMDTWLGEGATSQGIALEQLKVSEFSVALTREAAEVIFDKPYVDPSAVKPMDLVGCYWMCCSESCAAWGQGATVCTCNAYCYMCD